MTEPGNPFGDAEIAREVGELRNRLASLARTSPLDQLPAEIAAIRETLRRLSDDNEEVRRNLTTSLGLRVDDGDLPAET